MSILPGLLWALMILVLTGLPGNYFPEITTFWDWISPDKAAHLMMFGTFTFLVLWGYRTAYRIPAKRKRLIFISLLAGLVYGGLTEVLQNEIFVRRDGNIYDFMANTLGGGLGILLFHLFYRKKNIS